jgi:hypothetical protein
MFVIPPFGRLRQEGELDASLSYRMRPHLKINKKY